MKKYRHIAWDWNGTLMDDVWLSLHIINALLVRRGIATIDVERYREVFGFPLRDYCRRLGFDLERDPFEVLSDEFSALYEARRCECALYAGAALLLKQLGECEIKLSLLSAYSGEKLRELIDYYRLDSHFSHVVGVDNDYGEGKVERGLRCMRELGWAADEMLYIGDTLHDAQVAEAMGVDCVLLAAGHQSRARLAGAGWPVLDDLGQLRAHLFPPLGGTRCGGD